MMNGRVLRQGLCRDFYGQVIIEHLLYIFYLDTIVKESVLHWYLKQKVQISSMIYIAYDTGLSTLMKIRSRHLRTETSL